MIELQARSSADSPMECFRCFDMKVVDPVVLESIKQVLIDVCDLLDDHPNGREDLIERINNHIILLEAMPDE